MNEQITVNRAWLEGLLYRAKALDEMELYGSDNKNLVFRHKANMLIGYAKSAQYLLTRNENITTFEHE
jgi:hypothetical protein